MKILWLFSCVILVKLVNIFKNKLPFNIKIL